MATLTTMIVTRGSVESNPRETMSVVAQAGGWMVSVVIRPSMPAVVSA
jgi:1-aminocyclopropane-1-carboxylate deaminase/D-cysteine desulfhydrase-like pyridoxal-dependent ACC family enzyme